MVLRTRNDGVSIGIAQEWIPSPVAFSSSIGPHVKTTIEVGDELLRRAKQTAAAEGTTLEALIEAGLRHELAVRERGAYALPDSSYGGIGTQPGVTESDWTVVRDAICEGRGA